MVRGLGRALFAEQLDVLIVELGARQAGDMRQLLRIVRPNITIITPLAPGSFADPATLSVLRAEMRELVAATRAHGGEVLLCGDDHEGAGLGDGLTTVSGAAVVVSGGQPSLTIGGKTYDVGRDVGESGANALVAAVAVAQRLGIKDDAIRSFLNAEA
jgi:UDP-N-acetylmuramyl pentapeptide synthase